MSSTANRPKGPNGPNRAILHGRGSRKRSTEVSVAGRATLRYLRAPAQKTRLVIDQIRGRKVDEAFTMLRFSKKSVAADVLKLLRSAVANTENNPDAAMLDPDELWVTRAEVGEGPIIKRIQPQPMGRAFPIHKRQCHVTLEVGAPVSGETAKTTGKD